MADEVQSTKHYFAELAGEEFIVLTSFRRSGEAMPTTVWFADKDDTIYVTTNQTLGKVKRIRSNPRVLLTPSDRVGKTHGSTIEATARILSAEEASVAADALRAKYGETYVAMTSRMDVGNHGQRVFLAISKPA